MKQIMTRTLLAAAILSQISSLSHAAETTANTATSPTTAATLVSGIDPKNFDLAVRPQDDFYKYTNGTWLKNTEIPKDKSSWGAFYELYEQSLTQLQTIITQMSETKDLTKGSVEEKISYFYQSFMDESALEKLGLAPLAPELAKVDALSDKTQLAALLAHLSLINVVSPIEFGIKQDDKDSTKMTVGLGQSGLGLPDRDYYLKDDAKLKDARIKYQVYVEKLLSMSGDNAAKKHAADIVKFETDIAKAQWTNVQNRDPIKTYNKVTTAKLPLLTPHFDWNAYLTNAGLKDKTNEVIVSQPTYFKALSRIIDKTPVDTWKAYLKFHVINHFAPDLSKAYVDENFAFYGTVLSGTPENTPRWKRGVETVDGSLGEGLGKVYVDKYFPPENKAKMLVLVDNLIKSYQASIHQLDWMSPATKIEAQKKLSTLMVKVGYPDKWRDYSSLEIKKDDLIGNEIRSALFASQYEINKLGKPVDRAEWGMTPQTVNAYYNPSLNEIVFPAAILQPPFFDAKADDAVNYGGIGGVIGHEISHAFDDQGSQYDEVGNLRNWWTAADHKNFAVKTKALVAQYSAYSPVPGYKVNGELTLGENIADNSGLAIAYKAYHLSLAGKEAPVIDGKTGDQRLYLGWAQVWREKVRDDAAIMAVKTDPHSPSEFRGNGALLNQPAFFKAFDIKEGDKMYLPPEKRVVMW
ncbi:M13 family metallopeptidase [Aquirhabdus sp.]|uniref:M13 family metallopeptidase n=1 Tax=Aquirhabdus sp. TaxID=2824160 RepID=UPI00396CA532